MADVYKVSEDGIKAIKVDDLGGRANEILQGIYVLNPSVFTGTPPVTEAVLGAGILLYNNKRAAYKQGGLGAKLPYEGAHTGLIDLLIELKPYVDEIADGNEDIYKLSKMPYDTGTNDTAAKIAAGAVPLNLVYSPDITGAARVSCDAFDKNTKFHCVAVQGGLLPAGTFVSLDGQLMTPGGLAMPPCIFNFNGKRNKILLNMVTKTDYFLYMFMMYGSAVSGLSAPLKIICGN